MHAGCAPVPRTTPKDQSRCSSRPIGTILTRLFTPIDTKHPHSMPAQSLETSPSSKSSTFIPFVNERNKMNRLILPFATPSEDKIPDEENSWRSYNIGGYKGFIRHTLKVSKKSKQHLSNLLNLETDSFNYLTAPPSTQNTEFFKFVTEGNDRPSSSFPMFRVKWQAPQKPTITLRKTAAYFEPKDQRPATTKARANAAFVSSTRDHLEQVRLKPTTGYPDMCRYDMHSSSGLRATVKDVTIPKAPLQREKPIPEVSDRFMTIFSSFDAQNHHKSVPDFSKQLSRKFENKQKKAEVVKDIEQMEKDFQFANQIKQKYDLHTIRFSKGIPIDEKKLPLADGKLSEAKKNIMRKNNIELLATGKKLKTGK